MSRLSLLICILLLWSLFSCNENGKSKVETSSSIEKTDSCQLNPNHSYEIYIPEIKQDEKLPLLVIIDAHGSGKFALNKFKSLLSSLGVTPIQLHCDIQAILLLQQTMYLMGVPRS